MEYNLRERANIVKLAQDCAESLKADKLIEYFGQRYGEPSPLNTLVRCTLYRVYSTYHESSESGTNEYGYFTDRSDAFDRSIEVAKERIKNNAKHSKEKTEQELIEEIETTDNGISFWDGFAWDKSYIRVKEIDVNEPTNNSVVGYT